MRLRLSTIVTINRTIESRLVVTIIVMIVTIIVMIVTITVLIVPTVVTISRKKQYTAINRTINRKHLDLNK